MRKALFMLDYLNILSDQRDELLSIDSSLWIDRKPASLIDLNSSLAQIVIGVRRSGKSTLCLKRLKESKVNFAYVNFDDERFYGAKSTDLDKILSGAYRIYGDFTHLFMDEVQNVEGWHLFVNRLLRSGMKIILTGSNANLLSGELSTHLTGRYHQIELMPFSFEELCSLRGVDTKSLSTKSVALRQHLLDEYFRIGGLPELHSNAGIPLTVARTEVPDSYLPSLIHAVVYKDVCKRYNVRYPQTLWQMTNMILDNFCQEISFNAIANALSIASVHTVKRYVDYLVEAYLICRVPKFSFKSVLRQSASKAYAIDPAFVTLRGQTIMGDNFGWMLENVVYIELRRRFHLETQSIYYLRQTDFEVDFVVCEAGKVIRLYQVSYDWSSPNIKQRRRELGGLVKAARMTGCHDLCLIVYEGSASNTEYEGERIEICRASDWLPMK